MIRPAVAKNFQSFMKLYILCVRICIYFEHRIGMQMFLEKSKFSNSPFLIIIIRKSGINCYPPSNEEDIIHKFTWIGMVAIKEGAGNAGLRL